MKFDLIFSFISSRFLGNLSASVIFFVIFSSIAGFISTSYHGQMLFTEGAIVGIGSLIGVYFGIKVKDMVKATSYKKYVLLLNIIVLIIMLYKTI